MTMPTQPQPTLEQGLRELHAKLWKQLQSELSWSDAERVLLDSLARSSHLLEKYVPVPQYNTPWETVRPSVVNTWIQLAKLLGRNTPEAVKADTKAMIQKIADKIQYNPGLGRSSEGTPETHIEQIVTPLLDEDQKPLAFDMTIYRIPTVNSLMRLYNLVSLRRWRKATDNKNK